MKQSAGYPTRELRRCRPGATEAPQRALAGRWALFLLVVIVVSLLVGCGRLATPPPSVVSDRLPTPSVSLTPEMTRQPPATHTATATPALSPTPTASPTPMIYVVQLGDTILTIAAKFNRSTASIQAINGLIDPRQLTVGQVLIIPAASVANEQPTPSPTPPPLTIGAVNFQRAEPATLWALGEVTNPGRQPVSQVLVEATLLDERGIVLLRKTAFSQLDVIQPGQAVPFAILFSDPPATFAQYQVAVIGGLPLTQQNRYYFDLKILAVRGQVISAGIYQLRGQLRNVGQHDATAIRLVAVAYDAEAKMLAQRQADLALERLKAGATAPFEIDLMITHGVVDDYQLLAEGIQTD